jgi:hypothetical protein
VLIGILNFLGGGSSFGRKRHHTFAEGKRFVAALMDLILDMDMSEAPCVPPPPQPVRRGSPDPQGRAVRLQGFRLAADLMIMSDLDERFARCLACPMEEVGLGSGLGR